MAESKVPEGKEMVKRGKFSVEVGEKGDSWLISLETADGDEEVPAWAVCLIFEVTAFLEKHFPGAPVELETVNGRGV